MKLSRQPRPTPAAAQPDQDAPFCIQVEASEGCSLACSFCGINGIREKPNSKYKFMTVDSAMNIAKQLKELGWGSRLEFAMHGEPTMNPDLAKIIAAFRWELDNQIMATSNGTGILAKVNSLRELFDAGVNVFAFDAYEDVKVKDFIHKHIPDNVEVIHYPQDPRGNPHRRRRPGDKVFVQIQDISVAIKGTHADLNNHCGSGAPKDYSLMGQRCAKPFRELSIRWDGNVAVCCNDWRGEYKCGNVLTEGIGAVWNSEYFKAARARLYHGLRDFGPCHGCNAKSYRVGLLPDKKGRVELPLPTPEDDEAIAEALSGPTYTKAVLRPWEKTEKKKLVLQKTS